MEKTEVLKEALRRCSSETVDAALAYHQTGDPQYVPTVVIGIIERFVETEVRPVIRAGGDDVRLVEDLGIDSLLMVEIIIVIEETLEISINNEEIKDVRTMGELKRYISRKLERS